MLLIRQQEQAFRVHIESPDGPDIRREAEFGEGSLTGLVGSELTQDSVRFVEDDQHTGKFESAG